MDEPPVESGTTYNTTRSGDPDQLKAPDSDLHLYMVGPFMLQKRARLLYKSRVHTTQEDSERRSTYLSQKCPCSGSTPSKMRPEVNVLQESACNLLGHGS
ncbi:hypothetical protein NDU88_005575 [Pleurodeles waltl]|uniref:Uncharacterized protein n=1 Tax=Pleurodeles waltl TaxID=8319 RepID=A0AAV7TB30_PLEWA|nr:hypothetical protein NDU88_005575 [Pleurodeles waltl]